jgi:protoporphyrinogen oxidase
LGGEIRLRHRVAGISIDDSKITEIEVHHPGVPGSEKIVGEYVFSTMPVRDLILSFKRKVPRAVREAAEGLVYRDFITVGMLLSKMSVRQANASGTAEARLLDNWIYIQEPDVKVGRLQIFNNWSPYMVRNPENVWIGLEYFCNEGDELWNMPDQPLVSFAIDELVKIGLTDRQDFIDGTVITTTKTYPAYLGAYDRFYVIREFTDRIENLFLIGRNGMHKYNNQDHSMLTAMTALDNIIHSVKSKANIWAVNIKQEYHESK